MRRLIPLIPLVATVLVIEFVRFLFAGAMRPASYAPGGPLPTAVVTATDPGLDGQLGNYEQLYVRVAYRATQPIYVSLDGVSGRLVASREMTGGMYRAEPGSGEATLWIAFPEGTRLDALRVSILDLREKAISTSDLPARLQWVHGSVRSMRERPEWVLRYSEARQLPAPAQPPSNLEIVCGVGLLYGLPLLYIALQGWFGLAWRGGWRGAALLPLLLSVPAFLWSAYAIADNSNLGFLPFVLMAPLGVLYLLIAAAARFVARRWAP